MPPHLVPFEDGAAELFDSAPPSGPALLLIDLWAVADDEWRGALKRFDALDKPWIGVIVACNRDDPQTIEAWNRLTKLLYTTLSRRFHRRQPGAHLDAQPAGSLDEFGRSVRRVLQDAAVRYLNWSGDGRGSGPKRPLNPRPEAGSEGELS